MDVGEDSLLQYSDYSLTSLTSYETAQSPAMLGIHILFGS